MPPHVNYLLFALDNPEARCAARNENPESQGLHLRKREKGGKKTMPLSLPHHQCVINNE